MNLSEVFREVDTKVDTLVKKADELADACMISQLYLVSGNRSVPELMEQMLRLSAEVFYTPRKLNDEGHKLRGLLESDGLDETERGRVRTCLKRVGDAIHRINDAWNPLETRWQVAKTEYEKDEEIKKRNEYVGELSFKNQELEKRCEKAEKLWWWVDWEPPLEMKDNLDALKGAFVKRVTDLKGLAHRVREWCEARDINKIGGVNVQGLGNEDLIRLVAGEYLWKKLPVGMREKICANKDHTEFSWENYKAIEKRLKRLKKRYVNAPTRSKNDCHREGVPMAREVDGT